MSAKIEIYDTTLRDGTQAEDFNLSVEDKIRIAMRLDDMEIDYIEGGWPGSNPKDEQFFHEIQNYSLKHSKLAAFGSTHQARFKAHEDPNLKALVDAGAPVVTIFGKTWDVHVKDALRITLERNLELIEDSICWLASRVETVFYDAEHFFDGYKADRAYAVQTLKRATTGGAKRLVLCDTNGGTLPDELIEIIKQVKLNIGDDAQIGIHCHNDSDVAVANSLMAVKAGAIQVQGTMNGFGERCGNANLCSIIPALVLKMGFNCSAGKNLSKLAGVSRFVSEIANLPHNKYQPYVGASAFAHKGGIHVSAVQRNPETYEHIRPELVGNIQRILVSDLAGKSNILAKARQFGMDMESHDPAVLAIVSQLKELEAQGFQFEGAEASFEILMRKATGAMRKYFELVGFRVIDQKQKEDGLPQSEATIMVRVGGQVEHTAATGNGPVNALDNALRKAIEKFFPQIREMRLEDYKVRVLPGSPGTEAKVRVLIESRDQKEKWGTVGVSNDIIEASWQALVDGICYKLIRSEKERLAR
jgi:2-isopropylmalate synthase